MLIAGSVMMSCKSITPVANHKKLDQEYTRAKTNMIFVQEELKLVGSDFSFTEGCSADQAGNVFFTDQPNDKIWKYSNDGQLTVFMEKSGRSNGTYFDKQGNLLTCADEKGEIWSISPEGKVTVLLDNFNGKQLNGPNDLWIDPKGGIYFTDPYYKRPYWTRTTPDLQKQDVYYLPAGSKTARVVASDFNRPNGIVGTPDGRNLYVADIGAGKIFKYSISKEAVLSDKQLLINRGADGMTLDNRGNIYLTGADGVYIFDKKGKPVGTIVVPKGASNVCFSGKENNILFITAKNAIYTIPTTVKGVE